MAKRKRTKGQTTIYKTLSIKLIIEYHNNSSMFKEYEDILDG